MQKDMAEGAVVEAPDGAPADRLAYLYNEYVRMGDVINSYGQSSFEDFKLLGAIGALLVWPPLAKSGLFESESTNAVLLFGLVAILFIVAIIGVRDPLKQSVIRFYFQQLGFLEDEIRAELGPRGPTTGTQHDPMVFRYAEQWSRWERTRHWPIAARFQLLFFAVLIPFPITILILVGTKWHAALYGAIALCVSCVFVDAALPYRGESLVRRVRARFRKDTLSNV